VAIQRADKTFSKEEALKAGMHTGECEASMRTEKKMKLIGINLINTIKHAQEEVDMKKRSTKGRYHKNSNT
jgi:hypothetical protein